MSGDRELLELAAKAIGMHVFKEGQRWGDNAVGWFFNQVGSNPPALYSTERAVTWTPLTDDGETLRLAAKARINIDFDDQCAWRRDRSNNTLIQEFWGGDYPPCYRHAVLRAAAEIGKAMP